jgi:hypothetical protein
MSSRTKVPHPLQPHIMVVGAAYPVNLEDSLISYVSSFHIYSIVSVKIREDSYS